jgi:hypothetical protein
MKNNQKSKQANSAFKESNFKLAFKLFSDISLDECSTNIEKSDAFNMLGTLVLFDPSLDDEDETGLKYFSKSIEFDDENVGALLNIIETFGSSPNSHKDVKLFEFALNQLSNIGYTFSTEESERLGIKLSSM